MKGLAFLTANALQNQAEQEAIDDNKPLQNPNIPRTPVEENSTVSRAKSSIGTFVAIVIVLVGAISLLGYSTGVKVFGFSKGEE